MTQYECIWYNGDSDPEGYELLDFDPNDFISNELGKHQKEKIEAEAWEQLKIKYGFEETERDKVLKTLYLLPVDSLVRLG